MMMGRLRRWVRDTRSQAFFIAREAESTMCRCGHSALCHWDETGSCRLIDYVTEASCACIEFSPAAPS